MSKLPDVFKKRLWLYLLMVVASGGSSLLLFAAPVSDSGHDSNNKIQQSATPSASSASAHTDQTRLLKTGGSESVAGQSSSELQDFNSTVQFSEKHEKHRVSPGEAPSSTSSSASSSTSSSTSGSLLGSLFNSMPDSMSDSPVSEIFIHDDYPHKLQEEVITLIRRLQEGSDTHDTDCSKSTTESETGVTEVTSLNRSFSVDASMNSVVSMSDMSEGSYYSADSGKSPSAAPSESSATSSLKHVDTLLHQCFDKQLRDNIARAEEVLATLPTKCDQSQRQVFENKILIYRSKLEESRENLSKKIEKDKETKVQHQVIQVSTPVDAGAGTASEKGLCSENSSEGGSNWFSCSVSAAGSAGDIVEDSVKTLTVTQKTQSEGKILHKAQERKSQYVIDEQKEINRRLRDKLVNLSWNTEQHYTPPNRGMKPGSTSNTDSSVTDCVDTDSFDTDSIDTGSVNTGSVNTDSTDTDNGQAQTGGLRKRTEKLVYDNFAMQTQILSKDAASEDREQKHEKEEDITMSFWSVSSSGSVIDKEDSSTFRSLPSGASSCQSPADKSPSTAEKGSAPSVLSEATSAKTLSRFLSSDDDNTRLSAPPVLSGDETKCQRHEAQITTEHTGDFVDSARVREESSLSWHDKVTKWLRALGLEVSGNDDNPEKESSLLNTLPLDALPVPPLESEDASTDSEFDEPITMPELPVNRVSTHLIQNGAIHRQSACMMESINRCIGDHLRATPYGVATGDLLETHGFWTRYIHSNSRQYTRGDLNGFDGRIDSMTFGLDAEINRQWILGAAFSAAKTTLSTKGVAESCQGNHHGMSLYTSWHSGDVFAMGILSYAHGKHDYKPLVNDIHGKSSVNSHTWGLTLSSGYNFPLNEQWTLQPKVVFNLVNVDLDTINVNSINTRLKAKDTQFVEFGLGARVTGDILLARGELMPEVWLTGYNDCNGHAYNAIVANPQGLEQRKGMKHQKTRLAAGIGVGYAAGEDNNLRMSVEYSGNFMPGYKADTFIFHLNYLF